MFFPAVVHLHVHRCFICLDIAAASNSLRIAPVSGISSCQTVITNRPAWRRSRLPVSRSRHDALPDIAGDDHKFAITVSNHYGSLTRPFSTIRDGAGA